MNISEIRRRMSQMTNQINWKNRKSVHATKKNVSSEKVETVQSAPEPVEVKQEEVIETPAEPVVQETPVDVPAEPAAGETETAVEITAESIRTMSVDELVNLCTSGADTDIVNHEILRRARRIARKAKIELPEGRCEGDNVQKFIDIIISNPTV